MRSCSMLAYAWYQFRVNIVLPLSHKLGCLNLYGRLTVCDPFFAFFVDFFGVFLVKTIYILQLVLEPCGRTAAKKSGGPKMVVFRPFPRGKKSVGR